MNFSPGVLFSAGLLRPARPTRLVRMSLAFLQYSATPAAGCKFGAARHPYRNAIVDELGAITWQQLDDSTDRMAAHLSDLGLGHADTVGLLARNWRGFVECCIASSKLGADIVYLSTGSSAIQLAEIVKRESIVFILHDDEFLDRVLDSRIPRASTEGLVARASIPSLTKPAFVSAKQPSHHVILSSGSRGAPRGAARSRFKLAAAVSALSAIPLRAQQATVFAAPLFHAWGFGNFGLALVLGSTIVLHRSFEPVETLRSIVENQATALVVVPATLDRIVDASKASKITLTSLKTILSSGAPVPSALVRRTLDSFGHVLHSLYGSTEVAYVAVAGPRDLEKNPRTAGRPLPGVRIRIVDGRGRQLPSGAPGRILVCNDLVVGRYTDGSVRETTDGFIATGDVGVIDTDGSLTVLSREDDMLLVGGENVYPSDVEDVLMDHPSVADAVVVGIPDQRFGVRLIAHVVLLPGHSVSTESLQAHVRGRLSRHAVPGDVVAHDRLPRGATGKVLIEELE